MCMMQPQNVELSDALRRAGFAADAATTRLAGLTNVNHLVERAGSKYVLRIPGVGTSEYIDRRNEEVAARSAAAAGVNAEVVFFDATDGLMVTRFVDGAATMDAERFRDLDAVARAGRAFRELHEKAAPFGTDFDLFGMIDDYKRLLAEKGAALPDGYAELQTAAEATRAVLEATKRPLVPSHCDPLCENFLDTGKRMFVIDYEYAGNNDPMWDLGDLSVEGRFGPEQDRVLLRAYFDGEPPPAEVGRMVAYKAMCDLLWTLWGVIQHANGNPADDFWTYAVGRFERCSTLMENPEYSVHLSRVSAG
jgi:thiamine kinase-like enzyme